MTCGKFIALLFVLISCDTKTYYKIENIGKIHLPSEVKQARLIGLGEATHGTLEFVVIKSSIIKDLIENHGFTILAIEAHDSDVKKINDWLNGEKGDIYKLIKELKYWTFDNSIFINLLIWIRDHNSKSDRPVSIYGIDMQFVQKSIHEPFDYIKSYLPKDSVEYHKLQELDTISLTRLASKFYNTTLEEYREIKESIGLAQAIIDDHIKKKIISDSLAFWLQFDLIKAKSAIEMYENDVYYTGTPNYLDVRDLSMAKNSVSLLNHFAGSKMIIWTHNYHIKKKENLMGGHLVAKLSDDYINFCLTSRKGHLTAYGQNDSIGVLSNFKFTSNSERILEHRIWRSGLPSQFLMSTAQLARHIDLKDSILMLDVGAVYDTEIKHNNYSSTIIDKEYDYIIYLDSTQAFTATKTIKAH